MLVLLVFVVAAVVYSAFSSRGGTESDATRRSWEEAVASESSAVGRILLRVSRPLGTTSLVSDVVASPAYRVVATKVVGAGGVFAGSVEVFLAVQAFCVFLAATIVAATVVAGPETLVFFALVLGSVAVAGYPYNLVAKRYKERAEAVSEGLPAFAELLQMPLSAGMGVLQALEFTAERLEGPVAEEVSRMLGVIRAQKLPAADAFALAAARIGTPEAQSFFAAVSQAHTDNAKLIEPLAKQAEALRFAAFQAARKKMKRLPVSLVLIMALHFIPTLLVILLIPGAMSLGSL